MKKTLLLLIAGAAFLFPAIPGFAAEDFTKIKIFPENVGLFTSVMKQQFMAFGFLPDGRTVNITDKVEWISSDEDIVTIDESGLAVLSDTGVDIVKAVGWERGIVTITCNYPKTKPMVGPNSLLLKNVPIAK